MDLYELCFCFTCHVHTYFAHCYSSFYSYRCLAQSVSTLAYHLLFSSFPLSISYSWFSILEVWPGEDLEGNVKFLRSCLFCFFFSSKQALLTLHKDSGSGNSGGSRAVVYMIG